MSHYWIPPSPYLCDVIYANLANFRIHFKLLGGSVALDKVDVSHKLFWLSGTYSIIQMGLNLQINIILIYKSRNYSIYEWDLQSAVNWSFTVPDIVDSESDFLKLFRPIFTGVTNFFLFRICWRVETEPNPFEEPAKNIFTQQLSSMFLFLWLNAVPKKALVTSLCMQSHFSEKRGKYHCDKSARLKRKILRKVNKRIKESVDKRISWQEQKE